MPIVLIRVDERLIHGQVVVGWGEHLDLERMIVVDDDLAASDWEQELYCLGVPDEIDADFVTGADARRLLKQWEAEATRTALLFRSLDTLAAVAADDVLRGEHVNLGGIHHAPGRERALPYLFLDGRDRDLLRQIAAAGVALSARDLPNSREVPLPELLDG